MMSYKFSLLFICVLLISLLGACGKEYSPPVVSDEFQQSEPAVVNDPAAVEEPETSAEASEPEEEEVIVDYVEDYVIQLGENEEFEIH